MKKKIVIVVAVILALAVVSIGVGLTLRNNRSIVLGQQNTNISRENLSDDEKSQNTKLRSEQIDFASDEIQKIEQPYLDEHGCIKKNKAKTVLRKVALWAEQQYEQGLISFVSYNPSTDDSIYIKFSSGAGYLYTPDIYDYWSGGRDITIIAVEPDYPRSKGIENNLVQIVNNAGETLTARNLKNSDVTIDEVKRLGDYSIVIWVGHGGYKKSIGSFLVLPIDYDEVKDNPDYDDCILPTDKNRCALTAKFFSEYFSSTCETELYFGACSSGKDDVLAQSFLARGASVVCAYTANVSVSYEEDIRNALFQNLYSEKPSNEGGYSWDESLEIATSGFWMKSDYDFTVFTMFSRAKPILYFPDSTTHSTTTHVYAKGEFTLNVYDKDKNPLTNYHLKIENTERGKNLKGVDEDVQTANKSISLDNGTWRATITNSDNPAQEHSLTIVVRDGSMFSETDNDKVDVYTKFTKESPTSSDETPSSDIVSEDGYSVLDLPLKEYNTTTSGMDSWYISKQSNFIVPEPTYEASTFPSHVRSMSGQHIITADDTLWGYGDNSNGQVGDGTGVYQEIPVKILDDVANVYSMSGSKTVFAVKNDMSLWAWGNNQSGRADFPNGLIFTTTDKAVYEPVKLLDDVVKVYLWGMNNFRYVLVLQKDGSLLVWGSFYSTKGTYMIDSPEKIYGGVTEVFWFGGPAFITNENKLFIWGPESGFRERYFPEGQGFLNEPVPILSEHEIQHAYSTTSQFYFIDKNDTLWGMGDGGLGDGTKAPRKEPIVIMEDVQHTTEIYPNLYFLTKANEVFNIDSATLKPEKLFDRVVFMGDNFFIDEDGYILRSGGQKSSYQVMLPNYKYMNE